jgi:hypothetical protein
VTILTLKRVEKLGKPGIILEKEPACAADFSSIQCRLSGHWSKSTNDREENYQLVFIIKNKKKVSSYNQTNSSKKIPQKYSVKKGSEFPLPSQDLN